MTDWTLSPSSSMHRLPLEETVDREGNSPSPFAHLQDSSPEKSPCIRRTTSYDDHQGMDENQGFCSESSVVSTASSAALHSSFDASLLRSSGKRHADDDNDNLFYTEESAAVAPGTVRKLRRRSIDLAKKTPGREHSHTSRPSPSSSSRRRSHPRKSPMTTRRSPRHAAGARVPPVKFPENPAASPATPRVSLFGSVTQLKPPPQILTPTRAAATATTHTATTVNSSLNDSHETASPTPFRFTSFPASLPRVHHPRRCPPSTVKGEGVLLHLSSNSLDADDAGTNNTSLSSLSGEAHAREVVAPPATSSSLLPKVLEWKSPEEEEKKVEAAKLFCDDDDDDDLEASPRASEVSRTRLDFNLTDEKTKKEYRPRVTNTPLRTSSPSAMSPRTVEFHFHVDASQCSPIPGLPEVRRGERPPRSAPRRQSPRISAAKKNELSISNDTSSSSSSSKARRLRPMPDMSAFEMSARSPSSKSTDETMDAPQSPQLVCPPTPERTPAWAHVDYGGGTAKYPRQNSLIATKVLATCPIQVLDGHSSLENSLMDDEDETMFGRRASFSPVEEEEESPMRDFQLNEMFQGLQPRLTRHQSAPLAAAAAPPPPSLVATSSCMADVKTPLVSTRLSGSFGGVGSVISFSADFENLGKLGSGAFADVYKVRSKSDQQLYAVKRNRRQFRGKRDREMAMAEVRTMQRLQSVCASSNKKGKNSYSLYLLFFLRAWQEEGYFFCQTELCCRDTCREMRDSFGVQWPAAQKKYPSLLRQADPLLPEETVWKICHDVAAGLSHIHSHGVVHNDIKPSNIFLVPHSRLGALLKIGDFGMARDVGTSEDGQEGDTLYMPPELLQSAARHPSADIFSLGLTLYELASCGSWELPSEGSRWQELRNGSHSPDLPSSRSPELSRLVQAMISPDPKQRPTSDQILESVDKVKNASGRCDEFLRDYIKDINEYDRIEEEKRALEQLEADQRGQTPRTGNGKTVVRGVGVQSPVPGIPFAPVLFSPEPAASTSLQ